MRTDDPLHQARYLARHPDAAAYVQFRDFNLYRVEIDRAHLVAGFGRIHWLDGPAVRLETTGAEEVREAEAAIVAHMNEDHADAVQLLCADAPGPGGQRLALDRRRSGGRGSETRRLGLDGPPALLRIVRTAEEVRAELVRLVKHARETGGATGES